MIPTYKNPTQQRELDRVTLRREMKHLLSADYILDDEEQRELLDFTNAGARANALRLRLLTPRTNSTARPRQLDATELRALGLYVLGEGPRPRFARLASPEGHFGPSWLASDDPDLPAPAPDWPAQVPGDPGRYVQPKGRFADASPDDRWPS